MTDSILARAKALFAASHQGSEWHEDVEIFLGNIIAALEGPDDDSHGKALMTLARAMEDEGSAGCASVCRNAAAEIERQRLRLADADARFQRITDSCTRWDWSHCTTERELIDQIDHTIKRADEAERWRRRFELKSAATERWVPCSDHRDKVDARQTGCPYCRLETAERKLREAEHEVWNLHGLGDSQ